MKITMCSSANIVTLHHLIDQLIDTFPENQFQGEPSHIHLILDGGAFNGSYLIGALLFLKEMEKRNYICVDKISGCSVGSAIGLLYFLDKLDLCYLLNGISVNSIRTTGKLEFIKDFKTYILDSYQSEKEEINEKILNAVQNRLYISFHDLSRLVTKQYQNTYQSADELFETIIKSCFVPYLIDNQLCYQNRFVDGITPYFFPFSSDKKILYLNLCSSDKICYMFHIKNETTDYHRILTGLIEMHTFLLKGFRTPMCSYMNHWMSFHYWFKILVEFILIFILKAIYLIKSDHFCCRNDNILGYFCTVIFPNILNQVIYYLSN